LNVRIVHLSDVHFGIENEAATEAAIAAAHGQCPDVVIVTGDMTLGGKIREFEAARNWLSRLPRPLLVTPGNHDTPYWNLPLRAFAPFARYRRYIDPLSEPAIDLPRIVARTINTARGMQPRLDWSKGAVNLRAIQQAAEQMSEVPAALRILVCHHPLVEPEAVAVTGAVHRGEAAALMLAEAGVDLILSGHVHNPFAVALAGRNDLTYTVGAGTLSLRTRGSPESFSVIEADENDIKISALAWSGKTFEPFLSWLLPRRRS
jgi:3',5'-cyclic AMP phosphodiesterase CpdA